jgi:hypothetical protein
MKTWNGALTRVRASVLLAASALVVSLGILGVASSSAMAEKGYGSFAQCPTENPEVAACLVAVAETGKFTIGKKTVPIEHPITLQGGLIVNEETGALKMAPAKNGETLSKTAQKVPGGLIGIEGLGGEVTATAELAGLASSVTLSTENLIAEKGTALSLPLKLKLGNPFLGSKCYGGSNAKPIVVEFTTGATSPPPPNTSIKGKAGSFGSEEEGEILVITENSLVNNTFAAPGVHGCGVFPPLVDPLVDLGFGVPAASGKNTAILNGTIKIASAESVREHS